MNQIYKLFNIIPTYDSKNKTLYVFDNNNQIKFIKIKDTELFKFKGKQSYRFSKSCDNDTYITLPFKSD